MAPLFPTRDENPFFLSNDFISPPIARSNQRGKNCSVDAVASDMRMPPLHKEHALLAVDSRHHGTYKSISLDIAHNSVLSSRFNEAIYEQRRLLRSPTSSCAQVVGISTVPPATARDLCRKIGWLKARVHYERDWNQGRAHKSDMNIILVEAERRTISTAIGPERKQIAFVKEENPNYSRQDRAGTPHNSELQADDDMITPFSGEELGMGGEVEAFATRWHDCNATTICSHNQAKEASCEMLVISKLI